jgi:hypothetical protein
VRHYSKLGVPNAGHLGEPALRKAMDEYDRESGRVSGFDDVEPNARAAWNHVILHHVPALRF